MRIGGHLAGGFLVTRQLVNRMRLSKSDRIALLSLGTLAGALPDLDGLIHLARTRSSEFGSEFQHHKWITHTLPFYVVPGILVYLYGLLTGRDRLRKGTLIVTVGACTHFLQDMIGSGDGIMWAWPFSRRMGGISLLGVHGREWAATYARHPIAWVERIINITAILTFTLDLFKWLRPVINRRLKQR